MGRECILRVLLGIVAPLYRCVDSYNYTVYLKVVRGNEI